MTILPSTAPEKGSMNLLTTPSDMAPTSTPPKIADAAEHDDHEAVDDVGLAQIGAHIVDLAERHAGHARHARAERESHAVHLARPDAHGVRHRPVLRHRPHFEAEGRVADDRHDRGQHGEREQDDPDAVVGERDSARELQGAAHPFRVADFPVGRPEDRADRLAEDEAHTPGGQQGFQRPPVEPADDGPLQPRAERRGGEEGRRRRDGERQAEELRREGAEQFLDHEGGVGADHHHLAMRHVDDAHDAECDRQPDRRQQEDRSQADPLEDRAELAVELEPVLDLLQGRAGGLADGGAGVRVAGDPAQNGARLRRFAGAQPLRGRNADLRRRSRADIDRRKRQFHGGPHLRVGFAFQRGR